MKRERERKSVCVWNSCLRKAVPGSARRGRQSIRCSGRSTALARGFVCPKVLQIRKAPRRVIDGYGGRGGCFCFCLRLRPRCLVDYQTAREEVVHEILYFRFLLWLSLTKSIRGFYLSACLSLCLSVTFNVRYKKRYIFD